MTFFSWGPVQNLISNVRGIGRTLGGQKDYYGDIIHTNVIHVNVRGSEKIQCGKKKSAGEREGHIYVSFLNLVHIKY